MRRSARRDPRRDIVTTHLQGAADTVAPSEEEVEASVAATVVVTGVDSPAVALAVVASASAVVTEAAAAAADSAVDSHPEAVSHQAVDSHPVEDSLPAVDSEADSAVVSEELP